MIEIGKTLISDDVVSEQFVCDLTKCKGACCVEGDLGAPLNEDELEKIEEVIDTQIKVFDVEQDNNFVYIGKKVNT